MNEQDSGMRAPGRIRTRAKRADLIAEEILRWVLLTGKKPGDPLPKEKDLLEMFECSRGTIRETLKSLEVQGLVEITTGPNGGARLTRVSEHHAMQLLVPFFYFRQLTASQISEARLLLEPMMVRQAIDHLTEADFSAMQYTIDQSHEIMEGGTDADFARQRAFELQFHNIIASRIPNVLLRFYCGFVNHLLFAMSTPKHVIQMPKGRLIDLAHHSNDEKLLHAHEDILEALRDRDVDRAVALLRTHDEHALETVTNVEVAFDQAFIGQAMADSAEALRVASAMAEFSIRKL